MRKKHFLIIDTETTVSERVADLGLVVADKQGNVEYEVGLLIRETYLDRENNLLFHDATADPLWGRRNLPRRYKLYDDMLQDGRRMLASVAAVNRLLAKIALKYNPVATAYNRVFDWGKAANTGINLDLFTETFCLWHAAAAKWGKTRRYRNFVLQNHFFGNRTPKGNMIYGTKADYMAKFLLGDDLPNEPHTALEDARDYELPILRALVKNTSPREYMEPPAYRWQDFQVKNGFRAI